MAHVRYRSVACHNYIIDIYIANRIYLLQLLAIKILLSIDVYMCTLQIKSARCARMHTDRGREAEAGHM